MWIIAPVPKRWLNTANAQLSVWEKRILWLGAIVAFLVFWFGCRLFRIPMLPHFSASLLEQPFATLIVVLILFLVCVLIGSLTIGVIGFDAGLFCACAGLCAVSARGGGIRFTLFEDPSASIWIRLTSEIVILGAFLSTGTLLQHALHHARLLHNDEHRHVVSEIKQSIEQRSTAFLCNIIVMSVIMMFFAVNDRKAQVVLAVGVASFFGTMAAYYVAPTRPSGWFWCAPLIVGAIGYLLQYIGRPPGWQIGEIHGTFAALARPMPLDYAGAGVASSIVSYWISRRWQHEREVASVAGTTEP